MSFTGPCNWNMYNKRCDELSPDDKNPENSTIFMVRHGYSLANRWKDEHNSNYINTETSELYNLRDAELSYEGIKTILKTRDKFWFNVINTAKKRPIRIFVSPLKRTIQTCLLSLQNNILPDILHTIKITITPFLTETGNSKENQGMLLDALKVYPPLLELQSIVKELDFLHFEQNKIWWTTPVEKNINSFFKYMRQRRYKWNNKECIVCFTHYGFIKRVTDKYSLSNFGTGHYVVKNDGETCYTHQKWVLC